MDQPLTHDAETTDKGSLLDNILGYVSKSAPYFSVLFYITVTAYFSVRLIQAASGASLETPENDTTVITIDLLQAVGFLVAWTALFFAVFRVVGSALASMMQRIEKLSWAIDQTRTEGESSLKAIEEKAAAIEEEATATKVKLPEIEQRVEESIAEYKLLTSKNQELERENERLRETLSNLKSKYY